MKTTETLALDPIVAKFVDKLESSGGPPIYKLSIPEARALMDKLQEFKVDLLPAQIEDLKLPVGPRGETSIRIVRPEKSKGALPVIMYFHGGGWILCNTKTHDRLIRELANGAGAAVVFVNYTPSPEARYPVAIEQAYAATKYIAEHAKEFNFDAKRIAVAGDSVGGNMAAVVALLAKERGGPKIDFQLLFYPVTDANFENGSYKKFANGPFLTKIAMEWFWNAYEPDVQKRNLHTVCPLQATIDQLKGLPPALVITDENDVLRDEGEAYAHKLIQAGVPVIAVRFLGTHHDFVMLNPLANSHPTRGAIALAIGQLRKVFGH